MTEAEWEECADPERMLGYLRRKAVATPRKLRLYACACCRTVWHSITEECGRSAVEVAERLADGLAGDEEAEGARRRVWEAYRLAGVGWTAPRRALHAVLLSLHPQIETCIANAMSATWSAALDAIKATGAGWDSAVARGEGAKLAALLREIIPTPLARRRKQLAPGWRTSAVVGLAQAAYEERILPSGTLDCQRLAVLADALEEAGCTERTILDHLRGPGPHVRGCWGVDLCLGK
jgi:hypothetical protein